MMSIEFGKLYRVKNSSYSIMYLESIDESARDKFKVIEYSTFKNKFRRYSYGEKYIDANMEDGHIIEITFNSFFDMLFR